MVKISVRVPNIVRKSDSPLISDKQGISWPAIPGDSGARLYALLFQLEKTQWWSPEKLRKTQFDQALNVLQHARKTVPFYDKRLSFLDGVTELTETLWNKVPILNRQDLQQYEELLLSTAIPKSHGPISEIQSSGSTGRPVRVKRTETFMLFHSAFTLREHLWIDQNLNARQMVIRSVKGLKPGRVKIQQSWGPPFNRIYNTGQSVIMEITTDIETQLENMVKYQPDYLLTYPSNLQALLNYDQGEVIKKLNLKQVRTLSESVSDDLRKQVFEKLGLKLVDVYSAHEIGVMALQCPEHQHYHVQSENVLLEVLNDDGLTCKPGEVGRIVVTCLHNFAMPLIRYSLLDYAEVGEPCDCGRGLPVLKRILGRERNMVVSPDGKHFWPSFPASSWMDIAPVRQLQLIQHDLKNIEAKMVTAESLTKEQEKRFRTYLQSRFGDPFTVRLTYVDEISRTAGNKYEDFISKVKQI